MIDDKCPTCPMYGKGYCDCGRNKYLKTDYSLVKAFLFGLACAVLVIILIEKQ